MLMTEYEKLLKEQGNKNMDVSQLVAITRWMENSEGPVNFKLLEKRLRTDEGKFLAKLILKYPDEINQAKKIDLIRAAQIQQLGTGKSWEYYYELMNGCRNEKF
jgi:hypothetical protein